MSIKTYLKLFGECVFLVAIATACAKPSSQPSRRSEVKDLAADPTANNVALIIGAPTDLPGVTTDIKAISELFKKPELGFKVVVKNFATSSDFLKVSAEVAQGLDENSTLFWYYSGHGLQDGSLFAQDQRVVHFANVLKAMKQVRTKPFKRLIVVMDSCFSGQNVNGTGTFVPEIQDGQAVRLANAVRGDFENSVSRAPFEGLFEQAIVIAAARRNQPSLDGGARIGGIFTASWRNVLKRQFAQKTASIGDMVTESIRETVANSQGGHTPVFRASPESILNEPLIGVGGASNSGFQAFFALAGQDESKPFVVASVATSLGITGAVMCRGDAVACRTSDAAVLSRFSIHPTPAITDRLILKSDEAVLLQNGSANESGILTTLFLDKDGKEVGVKSIRAKLK